MRKLLTGTFTLLLVACASTPDLPPSAGFSRVEFSGEVAAPELQKLLGWHDGLFYYARRDGAVQVTDGEAHAVMTLQAKGGAALKAPETVVVGNDTVYIVDSATSQVAMFSLEGEYRGSFGSKGSGRSDLSSPRGIAFYDGVLYVADSGNERVQLFGDNGVFLATLEIKTAAENVQAKEADLPYELNSPADIDLDAEGHIYVLDRDDSLIKVYTQRGGYLRHIAIKGRPTGFRVASDGIYVADQASYTIQKFRFDGTLAYYFGSKGDGRSQFKGIAGLALDGGRKIFVGDDKKAVTDVFLAEKAETRVPGNRELSRTSVRSLNMPAVAANHLAWNGTDTLYAVSVDKKSIARIRNGVVEDNIVLKDVVPVAMAVDPDGALWVVDSKKLRIVHLDNSGNIISSFASEGSGAGQLDEPTDMAISSNGIIFVADPGNEWVQAFSRDGLFLSVIRSGSGGNFDEPVAIALDPHDNLYVLDRGLSSVSIFSAKGEARGEFGNDKKKAVFLSAPIDLMATHDEVQVLEGEGVKVFSLQGDYLRSFGARGKGVGALERPSAITAIDSTTFAIADAGNQRIQTLATLNKPAAPTQAAAQGRIHGADIQWAADNLPYIKQYAVYRSARKDGAFSRVGETTNNSFSDTGLAPNAQYFYRVAAENHYGYEGPMTPVVSATAMKYSPAVLDGVTVEAHEWSLALSWKALETEYVKNYLIYEKREGELVNIAKTTEPAFIRDALAPNTDYSLYVSTLSVDGIESEKLRVVATTLANNRAPLEIETLDLSDIFSNSYKLYEQDGLGRVRLTNNTATTMENIKIAFSIKNFMDFATETRVALLEPGESQEIPLKAVFNNNILTVTEDTPVQTELVATYFENGQPKTYSKNQAINVYEKHRLSWNERGRFAAFVTPKDPVVLDYARGVATQFPDTRDPLQWAASIFSALGITGVTYIQDPSNPYQVTSGATDYVDYVQYARETLERKSGDCDDLVALYSSALESMGIATRVIEVPGHMLMMLSTGISADSDGYTMDNMYVSHDDVLWIPVEATLIGNSFTKAWESGAETYYKWQAQGLTILNVHEAWGTYKPASLPSSDWKPNIISRAAIEERFPDQHATLLRIVSRTRMRHYLQAIEQNPQDLAAHLQAGIISAKAGDTAEAARYFETVLTAEPANSMALNNRANLRYMEEKYQAAAGDYELAAQADPQDALIWINLAKSYKALKNMDKARRAFIKAQEIDPSLKKKYRTLSIELLGH